MIVRLPHPQLLATLALLTACAAKSGEVGALDSTDSGTDGSTTGGDESSETVGTDGSPPLSCEDLDNDGVPDDEDNALERQNQYQTDVDHDGIADVIDLCPTIAGNDNLADDDGDGIGNECDTCRQAPGEYNDGAELAGVPSYLMARNVPSQADFDEDGIGDACDNCPWTPNCDGFGDENPYQVGDPIAYDDEDLCQSDTDDDLVGDACQGMVVGLNATAPVGLGNDDDFDQDGISNELDTCPRQPIYDADAIACSTSEECPADRSCDDGWCNHPDRDNDAVGDACDTCSWTANPNQVLEGGAAEDDADGDFVGSACETSPACSERSDARPYGFHLVHVEGNCCTVRLVESPDAFGDVAVGDLLDTSICNPAPPYSASSCTPLRARHPEDPLRTLPVRTAEGCPQEQVGGEWVCRQLRPALAATPGILVPPPGCDEALAAAYLTVQENTQLELNAIDFSEDPSEFDGLWQNLCFLPQVDVDVDGLGSACDLCPLAHDPDNTQYVDDQGMLWPDAGKFCNGAFACE